MHCVAGEGWSPAEPEHWGEASRRRSCVVRRAVRIASPLVAQRVVPHTPRVRTACTGGACAPQGVLGHAPRRRGPGKSHLVAYQHPGRVDHHHHRSAGNGHDDDGSAHDNDNGAAPADHDDDSAATTTSHDHHDGTRPPPTNSEGGQATWYSEAPDGYCASPTLPFGTVMTVTNDATGTSTTCTVNDREDAGYPGEWSTCRRRASSGSPHWAREWRRSQSPGDPFRRRHRTTAVGARDPPQPGSRSELRGRPEHGAAHRPPLGRRGGDQRARDRRRPGFSHAGPRRGPAPAWSPSRRDRHLLPVLRSVVEPVGVEVVEGDALRIDLAGAAGRAGARPLELRLQPPLQRGHPAGACAP